MKGIVLHPQVPLGVAVGAAAVLLMALVAVTWTVVVRRRRGGAVDVPPEPRSCVRILSDPAEIAALYRQAAEADFALAQRLWVRGLQLDGRGRAGVPARLIPALEDRSSGDRTGTGCPTGPIIINGVAGPDPYTGAV